MKKYFMVYAFCFLLLASLIGCGSKGITVKGKVVFDGEPVATGSITFMPVDGNAPTGGGAITKGAYSVNLTPGNYKVQIFGTRVTGTMIAGPDEVDAGQEREIVEEYIPDKYNTKTTLKADLQKSNRSLDFNLEK